MKVALIITTYNRPNYLQKCLDSVFCADLSQVSTVMVIDDCSTDFGTIKIINDFELYGVDVIKVFSKGNRSIKHSLLYGCDILFDQHDIVINLDGDAIVARSFVNVLIGLKERFQENIITGFCCFTKNKDGSERHFVLKMAEDYTERKSVGGINMLFDTRQYNNWIRPALLKCLEQGGNWDDHTCRASVADGKRIITSRPSVIQHLGADSSMNHSVGGEPMDVADDFVLESDTTDFTIDHVRKAVEILYKNNSPERVVGLDRYDRGGGKIKLPEITLICADGSDVNRVIRAADIACREIEFGAVKILSHLPSDDPRVIKIKPLLSSKDYSQFVLKEMVNYVETEFMMIFQHDGFPINPKAWSDDFLKYDMVGASWKFRPEKRTANGGFSLRSKKMMEIIRDDEGIVLQNDHIIRNFAEDHVLFYIYRDYLEGHHRIKIAPEEVCDRFSIEAWGIPDNRYKGSFGFHGFNVDFNGADLPYIPYKLPNRQIQ